MNCPLDRFVISEMVAMCPTQNEEIRDLSVIVPVRIHQFMDEGERHVPSVPRMQRRATRGAFVGDRRGGVVLCHAAHVARRDHGTAGS
jgi:hypothetical protein